MSVSTKQLQENWANMRSILTIRNEREYLPELGSERSVSEVLRGKRELNAKQIRALAERFHVSPAVFI